MATTPFVLEAAAAGARRIADRFSRRGLIRRQRSGFSVRRSGEIEIVEETVKAGLVFDGGEFRRALTLHQFNDLQRCF